MAGNKTPSSTLFDLFFLLESTVLFSSNFWQCFWPFLFTFTMHTLHLFAFTFAFKFAFIFACSFTYLFSFAHTPNTHNISSSLPRACLRCTENEKKFLLAICCYHTQTHSHTIAYTFRIRTHSITLRYMCCVFCVACVWLVFISKSIQFAHTNKPKRISVYNTITRLPR